MFYEVVGKISIALGGGILFLILLSLFLGVLVVKKNKLILPKLLLFTIDTFYFQARRIAKMFGLGERIIDEIGIQVRNHLNREKFSTIPGKDRIIVVPQCLRYIKCPARLDSSIGVACRNCGKCMISELKREAEKLGYGFYIVPGGSFVQRIIKAVKPKAALGVACVKDLNAAMHDLSKTECIVQGIPLVKDGCVETQVDLKELFRVMRLGIEKSIEDMGRTCTSSELANAQR
jgi:hypothetical protein